MKLEIVACGCAETTRSVNLASGIASLWTDEFLWSPTQRAAAAPRDVIRGVVRRMLRSVVVLRKKASAECCGRRFCIASLDKKSANREKNRRGSMQSQRPLQGRFKGRNAVCPGFRVEQTNVRILCTLRKRPTPHVLNLKTEPNE